MKKLNKQNEALVNENSQNSIKKTNFEKKETLNEHRINLADIYINYTLNSRRQDFQTPIGSKSEILDQICREFYSNKKFSLLNSTDNLEKFSHDNYLDNLNQIQDNKQNKLDENQKIDQTTLIELEDYDYDTNDVISLNVDFSNDENSENEDNKKKNSSENNMKKMNIKQNQSREIDSGIETYKFELNPQKYSLELSTLSSTSSLSSLSSSVSSPSFSSGSILSINGQSGLQSSKKTENLAKSNPNLNKTNIQGSKNIKSDLNLTSNNQTDLKLAQVTSSFSSNSHFELGKKHEEIKRKPLPNYENLSFVLSNNNSIQFRNHSKRNINNNRNSLNLDNKTFNFSFNEAKIRSKPVIKSNTLTDHLKNKFYTLNIGKLNTETAVGDKKTKTDLKSNKDIKPKSKQNQILTIGQLEDHLMIKIFSNLNTLQKLQIQFVCKRWHSLIWSNKNHYKLFNRIEFNLQDMIQPKIRNSENNSINKNSSFKNFFKRKKTDSNKSKSDNNNKNNNNKIVDLDLVFKFLLGKFLNNSIYPKCNCVEIIIVKNSASLSDRSVNLISQRCTELKSLTLNNCPNIKSGSVIKVVENCDSLRLLDLTGCYNINNITIDLKKGSDQTEIRKNLVQNAIFCQSLNFSLNKKNINDLIDPRIFYVGCKFSSLQCIDLSYCSNVTDLCVENICKNCVLVTNLYIRRCKQLTDISLLYISKYCFYLRELSLSQCSKITDSGVRYLGKENQSKIQGNINRFRIKYLSLGKCVKVTDQSLIYLSKLGFFENIKYLNLRGCNLVTNKFLKYFTGAYSTYKKNLDWTFLPIQLRSLDLSGCLISDKGINYLCRVISSAPGALHRLNLRGCDQITDNGVKLLAINCKYLQHLNVTNCTKLTADSLRQVKINCKSCIIQHTNFSFC